MYNQIYTVYIEQKTLLFPHSNIPHNLDEKSKQYLESFIHYSNNSINDIRAFLLENESCEKCCCYTCAFTIIGLIPFSCWFYKRKKERMRMKNKIKECFCECAKNAMKKLVKSECIILFKENNVEDNQKKQDSNFNLHYFYELHIFNPITAEPFEHFGQKLEKYKDIVTEGNTEKNKQKMKDAYKSEAEYNADGVNTQRNRGEVAYKSGNYYISNQMGPNSQNYNQIQYCNVYQGNNLYNVVEVNPIIKDQGYSSVGNYQLPP